MVTPAARRTPAGRRLRTSPTAETPVIGRPTERRLRTGPITGTPPTGRPTERRLRAGPTAQIPAAGRATEGRLRAGLAARVRPGARIAAATVSRAVARWLAGPGRGPVARVALAPLAGQRRVARRRLIPAAGPPSAASRPAEVLLLAWQRTGARAGQLVTVCLVAVPARGLGAAGPEGRRLRGEVTGAQPLGHRAVLVSRAVGIIRLVGE